MVPDCRACDDPINRSKWGCDAPLKSGSAWQVACECAGVKRDCARADCEDGWRPIARCPHALIREHGPDLGLAEFFHSWGAWREHGVLPGPGSFADQPSVWCAAVHVADSERAAWDRALDEERREELARRGKHKA
jgi:hypothetical protein